MLFSISPGTTGSGDERYVATLPFWLSPGSILQLPEGASVVNGATGRLTVERLHHLYSASLGPFPTAAEAEQGLAQLKAAVLWCAIEFGTGVRYPGKNEAATLFAEPITIPDTQPMVHIGKVTGWECIDGHYDAGAALVRPDHKRLFRVESGHATVTAGIAVDRFIAKAEEALSFERLQRVASDDKLKLAIEVAMSHRFEASYNAQFITLVTSLEALLPDLPVSPAATHAVAEAVQLIRGKRDALEKTDPEWPDLERLLSRAARLNVDSVGEGLRNFVDRALDAHPELGDRQVIAARIREAYNTRSRLLHDGHVPEERLRSGLKFLREFVPRVLRCLFRETAFA
ncbi:MAG: hypothetical protein RBS80_14385 [Thermoguttaceae bacterium]|jgi:hypothetical protein|nr:hypothetical protein [Thermoguttaceae bacterium]